MGDKKKKNLRKLPQLHAFSFFKFKFEKFTANVMCLHLNVAQSNTLSVGK